jgi:hypothetical protein
MAYARTKILSVNCASTSFVMLKSLLIEASAGEIMDEEMGETRVKQDTMRVAAHLRLRDQFLGFAGSSGDSHVTCTLSVLYVAHLSVLETHKIWVLDTPATLLLLQLRLPRFDVVLIRYASSYLFIRSLIFAFRLVSIPLLFRAAGSAFIVTRRAFYIPSLGFGFVQ